MRPEQVDKIHEAYYELRTSSREEKPEKLRLYEDLLGTYAKQLGADPITLKQALREDFIQWCKQEGLPKPKSFGF